MTTTGDYGIGGARLGGTHTPSERAAGAVGAVERAVCERSRVRVHVVRSVSLYGTLYMYLVCIQESVTTFPHV